jgi:hypothetical protein
MCAARRTARDAAAPVRSATPGARPPRGATLGAAPLRVQAELASPRRLKQSSTGGCAPCDPRSNPFQGVPFQAAAGVPFLVAASRGSGVVDSARLSASPRRIRGNRPRLLFGPVPLWCQKVAAASLPQAPRDSLTSESRSADSPRGSASVRVIPRPDHLCLPPPEQKVSGSNPVGRTSARFSG